MTEWISVEDHLPDDAQHVLVWEDRYNVLSSSSLGDDGHGRIRMGDAVYYSGDVRWNKMIDNGEAKKWNNDKNCYIDCGNVWDLWKGQGHCGFENVTHWMPLPNPPKNASNPEPEKITFNISDVFYEKLIDNLVNEIDKLK